MKYMWRKSFVLVLLFIGLFTIGCSQETDNLRDDALRNVGSSLGSATGGVDVGENVSNIPTTTPIETVDTNNNLPTEDETSQDETPRDETPIAKDEAIIFVHGWNSSDDVWNPMRSYLAQKGLSHHAAIDLPERGLVRPISELANILAKAVDRLGAQGVRHVNLVSHSMGGLVCREYLRTRPANHKVTIPTLVTLATPHHGTQLFTQDCFELIGCTPRIQMNPDSDFIKSINAAGAPSGTKVYSIWTPDDEVVSPPSSCILPWAKNYQVTGLDSKPHSAIIQSTHVFELVYTCIAGS